MTARILTLTVLMCPTCVPPAGSAGGAPFPVSETTARDGAPEEPAASTAERWGIEVEGVRRTAAGALLDFRYRVVDAERAAPLMDHREDAWIVPRSRDGERLVVPTSRLGSMRQTDRSAARPAEGRTYFALFGNPGGVVRAGDRVDVVIGEVLLEDLVVQ